MKWVLVFAMGGLGALLRVAASGLFPVRALPWGTLAVNALGCLAIGVLFEVFEERSPHWPLELRVAVVGGLLGGFTTFSAFGLETWGLASEGQWGLAALYALGSLVIGIAAVGAGIVVARAFG